MKGKVKLTKGIQPEAIVGQHGFGNNALGKKPKRTDTGILNFIESNSLSGMGLYEEICIRVYKA